MMPRKVTLYMCLSQLGEYLLLHCCFTLHHFYCFPTKLTRHYKALHIYLFMKLLKKYFSQIALGGRYSRDFFNRHGDLRHIRRLRFWPLNKVLMEKYDFTEQDAIDMADFLVPILDFVPEKRPTAAQCLTHPWINAGPRLLQPSTAASQPQDSEGSISEKQREQDEKEAMEVGVGNIAINGVSNSLRVHEAATQKPVK